MEQITVRHLPWDSDFFSFKVGSVDASGLNAGQLNSAVGALKAQGYRLIYVFTDSLLAGLLPCFTLADNKRSYFLEAPHAITHPDSVIDFEGAPEMLYELAYQAGEYSRFRVDPLVGDDNFRRLYRMWIDNSLRGTFSDMVLVSTDAHQTPTGLITAKVKDGQLSIGLFATDFRLRGRGIGSELINTVIARAAGKGLPVEVTTQADNPVACRFYENKGFRLQHQSAVYHLWL